MFNFMKKKRITASQFFTSNRDAEILEKANAYFNYLNNFEADEKFVMAPEKRDLQLRIVHTQRIVVK